MFKLTWSQNERPLSGPPFGFWNYDWPGYGGDGSWEPSRLERHAIALLPDLPGELSEDAEPGWDECYSLGWQGAWAFALLQRQGNNQPLGERTDIIWNLAQTWGVQVRLQAVEVVEREDDSDDETDSDVAEEMTPGITDYTVHATVLRVFVRTEEIGRLGGAEEMEDEIL